MLEKVVRRYPVQIGNWKVLGSNYSVAGLLNVVEQSIVNSLTAGCGIFLSGGLDSSVLAILANRCQRVPCFTIGNSPNHPDVVSAMRLSKEFGFDLYVYIPSPAYIHKVVDINSFKYPGDECVWIALEFASHFVDTILGADGIDEQMGGYWWHGNRNDEFPKQDMAFQHFWNILETNHLTPMCKSASQVGMSLDWVYLHQEVVDYIARIPLVDRAKPGSNKMVWKLLATEIGVPEYIINRPKMGFVHALSKEVK